MMGQRFLWVSVDFSSLTGAYIDCQLAGAEKYPGDVKLVSGSIYENLLERSL